MKMMICFQKDHPYPHHRQARPCMRLERQEKRKNNKKGQVCLSQNRHKRFQDSSGFAAAGGSELLPGKDPGSDTWIFCFLVTPV